MADFDDFLEVIRDTELGVSGLEVHYRRDGLGRDLLWIHSTQLSPEIANGRTWVLPDDATKSDIVRTIFLALQTWVEHELREGFTYRGVQVMDPHADYDRMVETLEEEALEDAKYTERMALYG